MQRRNTQSIGEVLRDFFEDNTEIYEKIMNIRIKNAWTDTLGPVINQYTTNLYVEDRVLYVSLSSSVLRNELMLTKSKLIASLNKYAGATVINDIVIR
ncbi:MAG: DUF721 domain-containing protein [Parabacteroides sp.]|nr:DUF721 domain-containing protein [Parabacteroides sp.]